MLIITIERNCYGRLVEESYFRTTTYKFENFSARANNLLRSRVFRFSKKATGENFGESATGCLKLIPAVIVFPIERFEQ